ncbi:laminin subunit alpha-3-like [Narcine bancroftii]|uniref:laminin subunit alpha-3-like n=1 Tax=Narcine bancroftii TaxID=1343680 RepID=UPI00383172C2
MLVSFSQLFHVAYILIKFANSPRPDLWVLERSVDFGRSYKPWQYFAHSKRDCEDIFGTRSHRRITRDDDVICTTEYSRILPLENGEIVVSLVNGRPGSAIFNNSPVLREFTKATNIRLRFLRTNTLLGHLISKTQLDPTVTRRYYYSIKDISIGGRCVCNGHADTCKAQNLENRFLLQCECQHNTCGISCDHCCPGFSQKPWQPATTSSTNECELCNCHGHATHCYYDESVSRRRASMNIHGEYEGGGVCLNCQHYTSGVNCERCAPFYYRLPGVPKEAPGGCVACRCNPTFSEGCEETTGTCRCRVGFGGEDCNRCAPGHYNFPLCIRSSIFTTPLPVTIIPSPGHLQNCKCDARGTVGNTCLVNPYTQHCECKPHYTGPYCTHCHIGYFGRYCQRCQCYSSGVSPQVCDPKTGRCLCRRGVEGYFCERCTAGYFRFPSCEPCPCDPVGSVSNICDAAGRCRCLPNYTGPTCGQCAHGYYAHPSCLPCQCSAKGSYGSACDQTTGQCMCRPHFAGQRCDTCDSRLNVFPRCQVTDCWSPGGSGHTLAAHLASCQCLPGVESAACERCKSLFWKPVERGPDGCVECGCTVSGTVSGIGECNQGDGSCYCKPNVCGKPCDWCTKGHYNLQNGNYFGCQGCGCDVGGSANLTCSVTSGNCQCRTNVEGRTCNRPKSQHYFPDLHHLKYEIEDGFTPNGRAVRFGFDPQEFENFSWRGYAQMSSVQNNIRVTVHVKNGNSNLFHLILRYINPRFTTVYGLLTVYQVQQNTVSPQIKEITFPRSREPSFVTVSRSNYGDPFVFTPGTWIVNIETNGVLLDYLVLLPSKYYEAPNLQFQVTEPCMNTADPRQQDLNCLLYKYLPLDTFSTVGVSDGMYIIDGKHQPSVQLLSSAEARIADLSSRQVQVRFVVQLPQPGKYVLVLEYASRGEELHYLNVALHSSTGSVTRGKFHLYSCKYSFLCRAVAIDHQNGIAVFDSSSNVELHLQGTSVSFLLHRIYLIPVSEFCIEHVEPKVHCVAIHGPITNRSSCVASKYEVPVSTVKLMQGYLSTTSEPLQPNFASDPLVLSQHPPTMVQPGDIILLQSPQNRVTFSARVPIAGKYVVLVHFFQPLFPTFAVEVTVNGAGPDKGSLAAFFCPHGFGCRTQVVSGKSLELDFNSLEVSLTLTAPKDKALWVEYILIIPLESYHADLQNEKPLDKSFDFITACGGNSFQIDPVTSSKFCLDSARSLVAFYNDGAQPCQCNAEGSSSPDCLQFGGQCPCRPNVIGRQCDRCATGHYMFPRCLTCSCSQHLCDEMTGRCFCPPRTVKPKCKTCEKQTFSYHPLTGCEKCNCSREGIVKPTSPDCHPKTGQCRCKPKVTGRQCDRCRVGYSRYPDCIPCNCNRDATQPTVCDPVTGRCLCKENVEGARCDSCRPGSFHLDPSNPKGCTSCFCFGVSNQCRSSEKSRTKHMKMRKWNLYTANKQKIPVVYNRPSNTVVADVQELPDFIRDLHWAAPEFYLGDKLSSYGGFLSYQIKSFGLPSEGMTLLDKRWDVLLRSEQMTVVYLDPKNPAPDRVYHGHVLLMEDHFHHPDINSPVSREDFMLLLSNLADLQIRALYFSQTQRLSLGSVQLEQASASGTGRPATNVEMCSCPPNYLGESCQRCGVGYYRDRKGFYLGRCVPCRCHGHSSRCEDQTGKCIDCRHNTEGDHCERCQAGFFGDAAQSRCSPCECPYTQPSNNFATGCGEVNGIMKCQCKPGYTGERCERCAPGYFGNPLEIGSQCRRCQCSNSDSSNCDPLTGQCNNCPDCTNEEPKDTSFGDKCDVCDSCTETLLHDLNKMDSDLQKIKLQIQNANISASARLRMNDLDKAIKQTEAELTVYRAIVNNQMKKTDNLENDNMNLIHDIDALKEKAEKNLRSMRLLLSSIDESTIQARDTLTRIESVSSSISDLVRKLKTIDKGNTAQELAEVERMLNEMRNLNFDEERRVADREKKESERLLDRIRNTLLKNINENKMLARDIKDSLTLYLSKLMDLQEAMNEAADLIKKADDINRINSIALEAIKEKHDELEDKKIETSSLIEMASDTLLNVENLLRLLDASQEEYEKQGAELDGALTSLNDVIKRLKEGASKEPIVSRAEDHANNLDQLSKQLQRAILEVNQDQLLRRVINASDAYENIINAVNEAEAAAKRAETAAEDALQTVVKQDLPGQANELNNKSNRVLSSSKEAKRTLETVIIPKLLDVNGRLGDETEKKNQLLRNLTRLQLKLQQIKRDDVGQTLDQAKATASGANDIATRVMAKLQPIIADVGNFNRTAQNIPNITDFNTALNEAEESVKNLTDSLPGLVQKLKDLSQIQPVNNISKNIDRIRDLIDQAREAANKINVAMKFNGDSGVEVRLPTDLVSLKAYTSLLLYLKRPIARGDLRRRKRQVEKDMFVLYLGHRNTSKDYMGMVLEKNKLVTIYKLGSKIGRIQSERAVSTENFDHIKFERILKYGTLNYSLVSHAGGKLIDSRTQVTTTDGKHLLLNLDPKDAVFYVGGFPKTFMSPSTLDYPKYEGCIELGVLNEKLISLYNFKETFNINTTQDKPCQRYKPTKEPGSDGFYFDGTGYAHINLTKVIKISSIEQTVKTATKDAVLLYFEKLNTSCALTIEGGKLVFRYNIRSNLNKPIISEKELDITKENVIKLIVVKNGALQRVIVRVGSDSFIDSTVNLKEFNFPNYYLGGLPLHIKESLNMPVKSSLRGCVKNPKASGNKDLAREYTVGVSKGCSPDLLLVRTAQFNGNGHLGLDATNISFPDNFHIGLGFSTSQLNTLLLSYDKDNFEISLENGKVKVDILGTTVTSNSSFNDGLDHYLSLHRVRDRVYLNVDDRDWRDGRLQLTQPAPGGTVFLGGDRATQNFIGCINNVFLKRTSEDPRVENFVFSTVQSKVNLDTCEQQRAPEMLMLREGKKPNGQETVKVSKNGKNHKVVPDHSAKQNAGQEFNGCRMPWQIKAISGAYQFGHSPDSRLEYDHIPKLFKERSKFSIDVRTVSPEGIIFHAADKLERSYMTLYVSRGRFFFVFAVDRKRLKIRSRARHNDGQWHTVVFSRENNKGKLVIDGLRTRQGNVTSGPLLNVESPFYLGGIPADKGKRRRKLPRQNFHGCLRNFKLDGTLLHPPSRTLGVTPCFDSNTEQGAYFAAEGAYLVLDNSFVVGKDFELLFEVRPRTHTGVLFHVNSPQGDYLSLYMYKGKVTVHVNNGGGDFNTSVTPPSMCDGEWHRIAVIKRNNVVQLDVDAERDHVVGPSASLSTDTEDPLYVGGLPDGVQASHFPSRASFIGCMGNVMVNVEAMSLRKATEVHGAVSLTQCPAL